MRSEPKRQRGMEGFKIKPIFLDEDPESPDNITFLTLPQHIQAVRYLTTL